MSAFRGLVLLGAAGAAVSTLGMRAAEQVAPQDPSAQYQLATQLCGRRDTGKPWARMRTGCPERRRRSRPSRKGECGRRFASPNSRWRGARRTCSISAKLLTQKPKPCSATRFGPAAASTKPTPRTEALDEGGPAAPLWTRTVPRVAHPPGRGAGRGTESIGRGAAGSRDPRARRSHLRTAQPV